MRRDGSYALLGGVLVGAAAAYYLDPVHGSERRNHAITDLSETGAWLRRELSAPFSEASKAEPPQDPLRLFLEGRVSDTSLYDRSLAALRRLSSHPEWIEVSVRDGVVMLEGRVLETEVTDVVFGMRRVAGLVRLETRMEAARSPVVEGSTPVRTDFHPSGQAAIRALAVGLVVAATRPQNLAGLAFVVGTGFLVAAAVTRRKEVAVARTAQASVIVPARIQTVFALWSDARHLPDFIEGLQEVRETEAGVSQWTAVDPAGVTRTWSVETVELKPHRLIEWRTLAGSQPPFSVRVELEEVDQNRTRVGVTLTIQTAAADLAPPLQTALDTMAASFSPQVAGGSVPALAPI